MPEPLSTPSSPGAPGRARWWIPWALFVSLAVAFLDRMNLSFALGDMARHYGWSVEEVGRRGGGLMSLFFIGYGLSNMLLSGPAGRFGPRRSLLTIVLFFSLFTILGAPAAGISFAIFGATRFLLGISEGVHFPMMSALTKRWFPASERSRANSIWVSGLLVATFLAPLLLVPIIQHWGWRAMMVVSGALGLCVTWPILYYFVHDGPEVSPRVGSAERDWLTGRIAAEEHEDPAGGSWAFLADSNFYIALGGAILNNVFGFGFLMWMPTYFTEGRGMAPEDLKWAATLPYFFAISGMVLFGWLGDRAGKRALLAGVGYALAGAFAFGATRAPSPAVTVGLFAVAAFFQASFTSQEYALIQRILPRTSVARGVGLYNGLGILIGGGGGQWLIGEVIARSGNYNAAIAAITMAAGAASLMMCVLAARLRY